MASAWQPQGHPPADPLGQDHAADHQGDEDGGRGEAAPRAGAHARRAAVRRRRSRCCSPGCALGAERARTRCCAARDGAGAVAARGDHRRPRPVRRLQRQHHAHRRAGASLASGRGACQELVASSAARAATTSARRAPDHPLRERTNVFTAPGLRRSARDDRRTGHATTFAAASCDAVYLVYNELQVRAHRSVSTVEQLLPIVARRAARRSGSARPTGLSIEPEPHEHGLRARCCRSYVEMRIFTRAARVGRQRARRADDGDGRAPPRTPAR